MATVLILSAPKCAGGTVLARIPDFASCTWSQVIGGDRGTCQLVLPADSTAVSKAAIFNVIRITDDDGSVYEYRITGLTDGPHLETVVVQAVDLSHDLGRVQLAPVVGGVPTFVGTPGPLTATQIINNYVLPALVAAGITWVTIGTITPTALYSLTWNRSTPLAVMASLEAATKYEFWLSNNGDANYQINLGRRTTAGTPVAWVGRNVETLQRDIIVDEKFYTRATPYGAVLSGETEATHIGQHGWKISTVAGNNLTLANPNGGTTPIGADSQLNGLVAGLSFEMAPAQDAYYGGSRLAGVAYDPTRRIIWMTAKTFGGSNSALYWSSLVDGSTGAVTIAGSVNLQEVLYDAGRDEILVACSDAAKVERISAGAKTSSGNIATSANPSMLTDLNQFGKNQLAVGFAGGAVGVEVYNLATLALAGTLNTDTNIEQRCLWDSGSSQYFTFCRSGPNVTCYSAAYAWVRNIIPFGVANVPNAGISGGTIHALGNNLGVWQFRPITASTGALGTAVAVPGVGGVVISPSGSQGFLGILPILSGKIYAQGQVSPYVLAAFDTTASYALVGAIGTPGTRTCYDSTDDVFIVSPSADAVGASGACVLYRNANVVPSGRLRFVVGSSIAATQIITKPGGTLGPIYAGQVAELRADTSDTYNLALKDPASFATYGPVDGYPALMDAYKRNYKRDPQFAEWSGNRPKWLAIQVGVNHAAADWANVGSMRASKVDAITSGRTTAGAVSVTKTPATGADTIQFKSLPAGFVILPGAYIAKTSGLPIAGWVCDRVVADGSGNATVRLFLPQSTTWTINETVSVNQPQQSDFTGTDSIALIPVARAAGSNLDAPGFAGAVHLPRITNATQAWLRARFFVIGAGADVNTAALNVRGYGNAPAALAPSSVATGGQTSPSFYTVVLEQQLSLGSVNGGGDDFIRFAFTAPTGLTNTAANGMFLMSLELYIATAAACPSPFGTVPGDELAPWIAANDLLFNQSRSNPTINYAVQFLEDGVVAKVGQTVMLRDPARGIAALPRVMSVQRMIRRDANESARPIVQLSTRPLSAMEFLAKVGG